MRVENRANDAEIRVIIRDANPPGNFAAAALILDTSCAVFCAAFRSAGLFVATRAILLPYFARLNSELGLAMAAAMKMPWSEHVSLSRFAPYGDGSRHV
jgi:hypothetical protein